MLALCTHATPHVVFTKGKLYPFIEDRIQSDDENWNSYGNEGISARLFRTGFYGYNRKGYDGYYEVGLVLLRQPHELIKILCD